MQKKFLIGLFLFLSVCSQTFACGCGAKGTTSLAASNNQKACKNVVSFIFIDFSFLSPRATAADLNVGMPKRCMPWMNRCCTPQACTAEGCSPECCTTQACPQQCIPQCCPQTCVPQCCPCAPQCPDCRTRSMAPDENKPDTTALDIKQDAIIPVANKNETEQSCAKPKNKTSIFRIDFFKNKQETIAPDAKQKAEQQCTDPKSKTSIFKIKLFRGFKL